MARPLRLQYPGAFYHVMNRGADHQDIFLHKTEDRRLFTSTLNDAVHLWKIKIHAYSLMDNHYHLLIETPLGNLSRALRHIDGVYTQRFNRFHRRDGPLFRGRFKSILIQKETYFLELIRYIHLNGTRALKYPNPLEDPYTSHVAYMNASHRPAWLSTDFALAHFSGDNSDGKVELDCFVRTGIPSEIDKIFKMRRWPAVLGQKDFINHLRQKVAAGIKAHPEKPQQRDLLRYRLISSRKILQRVSKECGLKEHDVIRATPGKTNFARQLAMYFLRTEGLLSFSEIGRIMGGVSDSAVEQGYLRVNKNSELFMKIKNLLAVGT